MRGLALLLTLTACSVLPGASPEETPDPFLIVYVIHPGSTGTENEEQITRPLEEQLRSLPGLKYCTPRTGPGFASIRLAFAGGLDPDQARDGVYERVERARRRLPETDYRLFIWADSGPMADQVPAGWEGKPASQFEVSILSMGECHWSPASLETLAEGLWRPGSTALRAAVLLARDPAPAVTALLMARLEERVVPGERGMDAGDLVAAAAMAGRGAEESLLPLVVGARPHPDLEVRVECARTVLRAGREEVVPFLLTVLRALTPAEKEHPADWDRVTTLMWAKSRAAKALSDHLGIACRFRPDGAWAEQMAEADRLEALYAP